MPTKLLILPRKTDASSFATRRIVDRVGDTHFYLNFGPK